MEILMTGIFTLFLLLIYSFIGFIITMLIQGIVYWTTNFSIINFLKFQLNKQLKK